MNRNTLILIAAVVVILILGLFSWYASGPSEPAQDRGTTTEQTPPAEGGTAPPPAR